MKKVLVADDAFVVRRTLKLMLEKNGYEVVGEAPNGQVAVQMFRELSPDIVTMDITMPVMDGIAALREIKKEYPKATIIMVSALGQEVIIKEAVMYGAKGFIVKPFKEELVIKALSNL